MINALKRAWDLGNDYNVSCFITSKRMEPKPYNPRA